MNTFQSTVNGKFDTKTKKKLGIVQYFSLLNRCSLPVARCIHISYNECLVRVGFQLLLNFVLFAMRKRTTCARAYPFASQTNVNTFVYCFNLVFPLSALDSIEID